MDAKSGGATDRGCRRMLSQRTFNGDDQEWFARFSGDHNPMHMDPTAARRLIFGRPVVHGVHVVMWALDAYLREDPRAIFKLDVSFSRPVFLDEQIDLLVDERGGEEVRLRVEVAERTLASLRIRLCDSFGGPSPTDLESAVDDLSRRPAELHLGDFEGRQGRITIPTGEARREGRYGTLVRLMSERFVAELAALSRLVGMECPGLHSIFGGFSVSMGCDAREQELVWQVTRVSPGFSALRIGIVSQVLRGTITAFIRPEPQRQPSSGALADKVMPAEFERVRALIVGGSRGLGELTAKLLAAGGAEVTVTWHRGREDAESVAEDIRSAGGTARTLRLNVADPLSGLQSMSKQDGLPNHLFYFASPRITARRIRVFDPAVFRGFTDVYVEGFARTVEACHAIGVAELAAFYPSTVAIEWSDPDLVEYAAAKAAGESMAHSLHASQDWLDVLVERLPAVATDQTVTLTGMGMVSDPVPLMTALLRRASHGLNLDPPK